MAATTKPKKIWDNYRVLFDVQKTEKTKFVVAAATRDGYRVIIIREFYLRKSDGAWMPSRDGIQIPLASPLRTQVDADGKMQVAYTMKELLELLPNAVEILKDMPLADPANEVWFPPKETN